jgi:hypothetical protein
MAEQQQVPCNLSWEVTGVNYRALVDRAHADLVAFLDGEVGHIFLALRAATPITSADGTALLWRATATASFGGNEF